MTKVRNGKTPLLPPIAEKYMEPMGYGDFANMPKVPIMQTFPKSTDYRGRICNNEVRGVEKISKIYENMQQGLERE